MPNTVENASDLLYDLSLGCNADSPLWFIENESGYQEMCLALEECHDSTLSWQVERHVALTNTLTYPNAIENSSETLPMCCHRQMLKTLSVTNENVIQIIKIKPEMRICLSNPLHNILIMSKYLKQNSSFLTYWPKYVAS